MASLLDSFKGMLTPSVVSTLAEKLGEGENGITKAVTALAPTILAGLVSKSGDTNFMQQQFNTLSNFDAPGMDQLLELVGGGNLAHNDPRDAAGDWLGGLFGNKMPSILNAVSAFSGTRSSTTSSLLGMAAPMIMSMLGSRIKTDGLNVSGLANLLMGEKNNIMSMLPSGMDSILGLTGMAPKVEAVAEEKSSGMGWLWPLLLLLGLGAAIVLLSRNCSQTPTVDVKDVVAAADTLARSAAVAVDTAASKVVGYAKTLSSGFSLKGAGANGIERQLLEFIEGNKPVDKTTWFNFDRLTFETGSAKLDMVKSAEQLTNIFEILKAHPKLKLKIGGYTDNTGKEAENMKLSQARAEATKAALVAMGADVKRLEAEGYGSQHAVASNDTEEGRAQNRRIAVRVTEK
ncbi:MAG: DUF937 domain-containing protein [Saprospiraceae bacterium]